MAMKETKSESQAMLGILEKMEGSKTCLRNKVESLYMTLNVPKEHSHLLDVDTEYLKVLFLTAQLTSLSVYLDELPSVSESSLLLRQLRFQFPLFPSTTHFISRHNLFKHKPWMSDPMCNYAILY